VSGFATKLDASLVVTLGSLLADVPHTRPAAVTASATDPELLEELGLQPSRYEHSLGLAVGGRAALRAAHTFTSGCESTV